MIRNTNSLYSLRTFANNHALEYVPPARCRRAGDVQRLSGFYVCQSGEISQPDQFCLFRVFFLKLDQRVLKGKEVVIGLVRAGDDVDVGDCNFLPIATVF